MSVERNTVVEYSGWAQAADASLAIAPGPLRIPSVAWCGLMIAWIKLLLRVLGFRRTLTWIGHRVERVPVGSATAIEPVLAAEYRVAMAGALYPGRARCLEQSLALYYLLRRQGVEVRYCQGVQPHPFEAHAWVEFHGTTINDVPEHIRLFSRFPDLLP